LSRYYELQSNKPLYMTDDYELTYDDSKLPKHYGWQNEPRLKEIDVAMAGLRPGGEVVKARPSEGDVRAILAAKVRTNAVRTAPPQGLFLEKVLYR
jgi:hypothetical protein